MRGWGAPVIDLGYVNVFLTMQCNLACSFCASSSHKARSEHMSKDTIDRITQDISRINQSAAQRAITDIRLTGGEPTMAPEFGYALDRFSDLADIGITTNATFLNPDVIGRLKTARASVVVSIYPDQYETLEKGLEPLGRLLDAGIDVLCTYTLHAKVLNELEPVLDGLRQAGIKRVVLNGLNTAGRAARRLDALWLTAEKMEAVRRIVATYECGDFQIFERESARALVETGLDGETGQTNPRTPSCHCGYSQISIMPDGKLVPCNSLIEFVGGSLFDEGIFCVQNTRFAAQRFCTLP